MTEKAAIVCGTLWLVACGPGAAPVGRDRAAPERMKADVQFLADDLLEGRGTPGRGLDIAANYIESQLRKTGATPVAGGSYKQSYRIGSYTPGEAKVTVRIDGQAVSRDRYVFVNFGYDPAEGPLAVPLMEIGYGVFDPEKKADDFAGVDVAGKAVVVKKGANWRLEPAAVFGADRAMGKCIASAVRGARMLVYLSADLDKGDTEAGFFAEMKNAGVAFIRPKLAHASALLPMLVLDPGVYKKGAKAIEIRIEGRVEEATASNVLARVEGTDPQLKESMVLLSAHYDHIGAHAMPEGKDGIWNGADDNASGTAGVIELTRRIAARPGKRSTLIFFTSGEDRGIFGSAYYAANPLVPNQNITVQFNLDMIGRGKDKVQGIPFGAQALFDEAVAAGKAAGMEVIPDQQPAWRVVYLTDTYHFGRAGIPSLFFFTGTHADYHQPSDTGDKIEYGGMSKIVEITEQVARPYLDGKAGPAFVKPEWFRAP